MRSGELRTALVWIIASLTISCAVAHEERLGGESHFLRACEESCADDFRCLAGVCTISCESDKTCASIHNAVRCPDPSGIEMVRTCELTCASDAQCASAAVGLVCAAGVCREAMVASQAPDASSVATDAPLAMLLVDTSGSMEYSNDCVCETPACLECMPDCEQGERNRFAKVLEALSGTWENFRCTTRSRQQDTGEVEFSYDVGYYLPYNEPPTDEEQLGDGILDVFRTRVRFGVATFDGWDTYVGGSPLAPMDSFDLTRSAGVDGLWSYGSVNDEGTFRLRDNDRPVGAFRYPGTSVVYQMDTGIRGPQAGNGRLQCAHDSTEMLEINERIQSQLRRVRPYGGTPIAASLDDLLYYFTQDPTVLEENTDTQSDRHVILLTDGYPDDDYRSAGCNCAAEGDPSDPDRCLLVVAPSIPPDDMFCPYPTAVEAAAALIERGVAKVHVVGVGLDDPIVADEADAIAAAGGTVEAHLTNSTAQLREALQEILDGILAERND